MKKPTKPMGFDGKLDPLQNVEIDFNEDDDGEIIDLEDIIEMPAESINEDEDLDLDMEILDADADFDFDAEIAGTGGASPSKDLPMEDFSSKKEDETLRKSLSDDSEEEEDLFGILLAAEKAERPAAGDDSPATEATAEDETLRQSLSDDSGEEEDLFGLLLAAEKAERPAAGDDFPAIEATAEAEKDLTAEKTVEGEDLLAVPAALEAEGKSDEGPELFADVDENVPENLDELIADAKIAAPEPETTGPAPEGPEPWLSGPAEPVPLQAARPEAQKAQDFQLEVFLNELVGRIEIGLMENVRALVEARLPDLVREVIREEIEKIKEDLK